MGKYNMKFNGDDVKITVVDRDSTLVDTAITELIAQLDHSRIVGIDLKGTEFSIRPQLLLLYAKDRCLIFQLGRMSCIPHRLASFLNDQIICFVGMELERNVDVLKQCKLANNTANWDPLRTRVEIGAFAARVLKNADLQWCKDIFELANKSGIDFKVAADQKIKICPDWDALCFSEEEVKYAMRKVYLSYNVGNKLLTML